MHTCFSIILNYHIIYFRSRLSSSPCYSGAPSSHYYPPASPYYHPSPVIQSVAPVPVSAVPGSACSTASYHTARSESPPPSAQILGEYFNAGMCADSYNYCYQILGLKWSFTTQMLLNWTRSLLKYHLICDTKNRYLRSLQSRCFIWVLQCYCRQLLAVQHAGWNLFNTLSYLIHRWCVLQYNVFFISWQPKNQ